jgi:hypothetical protein
VQEVTGGRGVRGVGGWGMVAVLCCAVRCARCYPLPVSYSSPYAAHVCALVLERVFVCVPVCARAE